MKRELYTPKIIERINASPEGTVFVPSDFKDIADREIIKMVLSRLCKREQIRRLGRGIYEKPEYSDLLHECVSPAPDKIANAIARNYGWTIVPDGYTALNLLGLSTQVPNVWHYISDGPYKIYKYNNIELRFIHVANKDITKISPKASLIIGGIKALGKENINKKTISIMARNLTDKEMATILDETKYTSSWIHKTIKMIIKAGES